MTKSWEVLGSNFLGSEILNHKHIYRGFFIKDVQLIPGKHHNFFWTSRLAAHEFSFLTEFVFVGNKRMNKF